MKTNVLDEIWKTYADWHIGHRKRDWYVSSNGDDANDGLSYKTAKHTLASVEKHVRPGDTVWCSGTIRDGTIYASGSFILPNIQSIL